MSTLFKNIVSGLVLGAIICLVAACGYGYIENIIKLTHLNFDPVTPQIVLRCAGVPFAPLGVIMGFL
jgi:hypothetical protein